MPITKNAHARYERINQWMVQRSSQKAVVRQDELAAELSISIRQLNEDFRVMREELGAPLEYDRKLRGWRYSEAFDFVSGLPLRRQDVLQLRIAIEMLSKGGQLKHFKDLPEVLKKIYRASQKWFTDHAPEKSIYFDLLPHYDGAKHLTVLLDAIEQFRTVRFEYQGFHSNQPKTVVFDPYFLRHYDRRWYVGGRSHEPSEQAFIRVFPLERMTTEPVPIGFFHNKPAQYNAETYWKNIYGISVPPDGVIEQVILAFTPIQGQYFLSSPFFEPFEILENSTEQLLIQFRLMPNIELEQKICSYGPEIKVLAPESLAEKIKKRLLEAARQYR